MGRHLSLALVLFPSLAPACMGIGEPGRSVRFAGQTNIVVWDAEREVEHFVRDARFETPGASLGFIAPTPTLPEIVAVAPSAFTTLASLAPRVPGASLGGGGGGGFGGSGGGLGGVSVIERKLVAGYEATVLKATDGAALDAWMKANGYPTPRYAVGWLARYIRAGWYITAFKVPTGAGEGSTGPVRMTFGAAMPFNPYSVPAENLGRGGLSLYYISKGDERPKIGRVSPWIAPQWQVELPDQIATSLDASLKLDEVPIPKGSTVRFYRDPNFGRSGFDDLYFVPQTQPAKTPSAIAPALLGLGAFAFVRTGKRTR